MRITSNRTPSSMSKSSLRRPYRGGEGVIPRALRIFFQGAARISRRSSSAAASLGRGGCCPSICFRPRRRRLYRLRNTRDWLRDRICLAKIEAGRSKLEDEEVPNRPKKGYKVLRVPAKLLKLFGAGEGNRTLVVSLGSFCSAIELHPRPFAYRTRHRGVQDGRANSAMSSTVQPAWRATASSCCHVVWSIGMP
jgi:hypothetical protein